MSRKAKQRELGIQRRVPEEKVPVPKAEPMSRRTLYLIIAIALGGLALFIYIQRPAAIPPAPQASLVTPAAAQPEAEAEAVAVVQKIEPAAYRADFVDAAAPHLLLDVRTPEEFAEGHIAGAINIPLDELEGRLSEVPTDAPVVVYCRTGARSAQAASLLEDAGYTQIHDLGGITDWTAQGFPVE
jgi:phage shock protein E